MQNTEYLKLMAEWMEMRRIKTNGHAQVCGKELDFWLRYAKQSDGPILELGSGTGYVLVALLEKGFDISGVDTSEFMLNRCRAKCEEKKLKPMLYSQAMQRLSINRKFGLVLATTGNLSLLITDDDVDSTFSSVMNHLVPGGQFVFEFEQPNNWEDKGKTSRRWTGDWFQGANGAIYAHRDMYKSHPELANTWEALLVVEKYVNGQLVETEANQRIGRGFTVNEVVEGLSKAGFKEITATNWQSDVPANSDADTITVTCRKPKE